MSAPWLIVCASLLFSTMALCVKLASAHYTSSEIVFYRSLTGALTMYGLAHWQGGTLRTSMPSAHFWRSLSGVISLMLWFYAITNLPLATAMTLNYMSAVWMALFLLGGAVMLGGSRVDSRLIITVLMGFAGVGLILRPTIEQDQLWHGLVGLLSGMIAATAYLQVTALGRAGEPEYRIVFYFSVGGVVLGGLSMLWTGASAHTLGGIGLLLAVGLMATAAQLMMTRAYRIGWPLVNASLQYLGIAFSYVYGVVLFADRITWMALTGMALIVVAGIAASMLRSQAAPADAKSTLTET
jgi:drug/metabolite transporter (DMT)-like permease